LQKYIKKAIFSQNLLEIEDFLFYKFNYMENIWILIKDWDMNGSYKRWEYYESLKKAAIAVLEWNGVDEQDLKLSKPLNLLKVGEKNPLKELEKIHDFISKLNEINISWEVGNILEKYTLPWTVSNNEALEYIKSELENFIK